MKTIQQVVEGRRAKREQAKNNRDLTDGMGKKYAGASSASSSNIIQSLEQIRQDMGELSKMEREEVKQSMQEVSGGIKEHAESIAPKLGIPAYINLDNLEVKNLQAPQFERLIEMFIKRINALEIAIREITVEVPKIDIPEIKIPTINIPTINVPKSSIKVELPTINVPKPSVIIQKEQANENPIVREHHGYINDGRGNEVLDTITEYYKDGSKKTATGISSGDTKYAY